MDIIVLRERPPKIPLIPNMIGRALVGPTGTLRNLFTSSRNSEPFESYERPHVRLSASILLLQRNELVSKVRPTLTTFQVCLTSWRMMMLECILLFIVLMLMP